ncbi:MAG: hypothetical protein ACE5HL_04495 [Terriglobia bacterium]
MSQREKLSTTIAPESYAYLRSLIKARKARNLAEALDWALARLRRLDNRARLERDTAAYFARLSAKAAADESRLEAALDQVADEVDFDERPSP